MEEASLAMEGYFVNLGNFTDGNLGNFSNNLVDNNITDGNLVAMDLRNFTNAGDFLDLPVLCGLTITNESLRIVQVSTLVTLPSSSNIRAPISNRED